MYIYIACLWKFPPLCISKRGPGTAKILAIQLFSNGQFNYKHNAIKKRRGMVIPCVNCHFYLGTVGYYAMRTFFKNMWNIFFCLLFSEDN